jgi:hypothetical protein
MTICIAGPSNPTGTIFCATDMMLSMGDLSMSGDSITTKMAYYGENWVMMMAGNLSPYRDIRDNFVDSMAKVGATALNRRTFAEALRESFQVERRRRAETDILSPFGLTFDNYRDEGPKLGPEMFSRILYGLNELDLGIALLVAGFDDELPTLFKVDGKGLATNYQCPWAIGSGEQAALGYLFSTQTSMFASEEEVFYRVCCAKFAAEAAPGVGKKTLIVRIKKGEDKKTIFTDDDISPIREDWNNTQQVNLPIEKKNVSAGIIKSKSEDKKEKNSE